VPFLLTISINMNGTTFFSGYTLVDITNTGVIKDRNQQEFRRNQQRNWETVLQCIGLRAQPMHIVTKVEEVNLDHMEFGEMYSGKQRVWSFAFTVEHEDVFTYKDDPLYYLEESFDQVPVICGLEETARFILPIFYSAGAIKNIYFKMGRIDVNT
jgi:hypothetical protein